MRLADVDVDSACSPAAGRGTRKKRPWRRLLAACLLGLPALAPAQVLEQLIAQAADSHPSVRAQQAQLAGARRSLDTARWQFYPTPSASVESVRAGSGDPGFQGDGTVAILRLQQPLWTGGRLSAGVRRAEAEVRANEAGTLQVGQQLALRVVQAYGDWLAARLKMLAWERSHGVHTRLLSQVERRIEQGVSAESDVKLAVARLESLSADMAVARLQQQTALARLSQVAGRPVDAALLQASPAAPRPVQGAAGDLVAAALARDPATQAARAQVEAQEAVVAERRAALSPEVFLRLEQQHGDHTVRNAPTQGRVFVGLSTSLGAGLSSLSQVDAARQLQLAAQERVAAQEREVTELVLADHALATAARERMAALEKSLAATQEVAASYDRQFLAGRRTWLDVMNAARELAQTEVQLTDLQASLVVSTWRLAILAQGLPR